MPLSSNIHPTFDSSLSQLFVDDVFPNRARPSSAGLLPSGSKRWIDISKVVGDKRPNKNINEEANDKVLEVEQKYNKIRRPVYNKRNEIIQSIPDFWLTALMSHPAISDLITEEDQKILKYLVSLDVEDCNDVKSGYSITFNFATNPYFEDTKLTKTLSFSDEGSMDITGTTIKWKEGMDIVDGVTHEKNGKKRPLAEKSFFSWFNESVESNPLEGLFDMVAEIIKEDLWPNPLQYFNNEADQEDSDEDDGEGNSNDEDGEDEEDEE